MNAGHAFPLLTIADIARRTGLEESLLRFYESEYPEHLPAKILRGDALLFPEEAVESFLHVNQHHLTGQADRPAPGRFGRVLAITSGKGGVGKSNLALNLAIAIQRLDKMCVVVDGDLGLANIHLLAGIDGRAGIQELLDQGKTVAEIITPGPEGIGIISGGSGILALADSRHGERLRLIRALAEVEQRADMVIVDTGAGMGSAVRDLLGAADELLFVLTPDITSLADAYGLLKALHQENPDLGQRPLYSVVNMVESLQQAAEVANRFSACADRFLGLSVENIGYLLRDSAVGGATARRTPYMVFKPQARVSRNTHNVAVALMGREMANLRASSAFNRYLKMIDKEKVA
ncbi:MAG: AAA family ATPase [Desulfobulbaceae bacterium]|nr:AAA family ATPase [Desulfobulbaceae bacterium]